MSAQALIVGGGVIGLLTAYKLAKQGINITVLERNESVGREASWAGGGIISPLFPWRYDSAVLSLAHYSQDIYPQFTEELKDASGIDPELHITGLYWLDLEDEDEALSWAKQYKRPLSKVDIVDVERAVTVLGEGHSSAVYMDGVANIRNPRLIKSLKAALAKLANVTVHNNCSFTGIIEQQGRVVGIHTTDKDYYADSVVLCAGAWSGQLLQPLGIELPVEPVKGQMILFKCAEDFLPTIIMAKGRYAIPRRDGHILVGSTVEYVQFDKTPTEEALASLKASAIELLPELSKATVIKHWAGLRPGSPNGIPYIGEVSTHPGLWLNCGHFRNGVVLAPASCDLLVDLLLDKTPRMDPTPYSPLREL